MDQQQTRELPRATRGSADHTTRFVPAPDVASATHGVHTALLDMRSERYYTLDEVGTRIWTLIASGCSVGDIVARLAEEFDASTDRIEADLRALLARLEGAALIRRADIARASRAGGRADAAWKVGKSPQHGVGGEA